MVEKSSPASRITSDSDDSSSAVFADDNVVLSASELRINGNAYPITDIKKADIESEPSAKAIWVLAFLCVVGWLVTYNYYNDLYIVYTNAIRIKLFQLLFFLGPAMAYRAETVPAWLVLDLPDRRLKVLKQKPSYLKDLRSKINKTRKGEEGNKNKS